MKKSLLLPILFFAGITTTGTIQKIETGAVSTINEYVVSIPAYFKINMTDMLEYYKAGAYLFKDDGYNDTKNEHYVFGEAPYLVENAVWHPNLSNFAEDVVTDDYIKTELTSIDLPLDECPFEHNQAYFLVFAASANGSVDTINYDCYYNKPFVVDITSGICTLKDDYGNYDTNNGGYHGICSVEVEDVQNGIVKAVDESTYGASARQDSVAVIDSITKDLLIYSCDGGDIITRYTTKCNKGWTLDGWNLSGYYSNDEASLVDFGEPFGKRNIIISPIYKKGARVFYHASQGYFTANNEQIYVCSSKEPPLGPLGPGLAGLPKGYVLEGWYLEEDCLTKINVDTYLFQQDTHLYSKIIEMPSSIVDSTNSETSESTSQENKGCNGSIEVASALVSLCSLIVIASFIKRKAF